jgi:hypothetical protein
MTAGQPPDSIGLADAVASLRAELSQARREGEKSDVHFSVGEIEVELALEFGWTREAGGGFKLFSFVDVSGKAGASDKASQKVELKLTIDPQGNPSAGRISSALTDETITPIISVKPAG